MNFSTAVSTCIKKYAVFEGRASRSEYWYFYLAYCIGIFITKFLDTIITGKTGYGVLNLIWALATFLPSVSVLVRRLHDTGRSGWLALWCYLGGILLVFFVIAALTWVPDWISPDGAGGLINKASQTSKDSGFEILGAILIIILCLAASAPFLWIFYLTVLPGTPGPNKYGDNPLEVISIAKNSRTANFVPATTARNAVKEDSLQDDNIQILESLFELNQRGILSDSEYELKKSQILGTLAGTGPERKPEQATSKPPEAPIPSGKKLCARCGKICMKSMRICPECSNTEFRVTS